MICNLYTPKAPREKICFVLEMEEGEFKEGFKDKVLSELSFEGKPGIGRMAGKE